MGFTRNIEADRAVLGALIDRLGLPGPVLSLLFAHAEAVRSSNDRLGLVAAGDLDFLVGRHLADSLLFALVRRPAAGERWLDVGSGAGFPGLVLACCYPEVAFTLLEPLKRRAGFLELTAVDLGLGNVEVEPLRVEQAKPRDFDVAVTRALAEPQEAIVLLVETLRPGGVAIVAVSRSAVAKPPARHVRLEDLGNVDSPGRFFMMAREA